MAIKSVVKLCFNCVVAFILILLNGCSASKIGIEVLRPPETDISIPLKRIVFINRVGVSDAQTVQYVNGSVIAQYNGISDYLVQETMQEMIIQLNESRYVSASDTNLNFIPKNGGFGKQPIPIVVINRACKSLQTDAIFSLEGYNADIDTDSEVRYSTPVERTYGTVRIPYFDGEQNVYMKMFLRAYICVDGNAIVEEESELSTQVSVQSSGSSPYELNTRMVGTSNILVQAARKIGRDYATEITPQWETQQRKIYVSGSNQMKEAYRMAKSGNWTQATDNWYLLASSNNQGLASKATFNLILASEISGDLKLAKEWAEVCVSKYKMKDAVQYLKILQQHENEIIGIKKMFPNIPLLK